MPLWDAIAEALGENADDLENNFRDKTVEDTLHEGVKTVLLCESPSRAEIKHGHPLAGSSGSAVTAAFAHYHLDGFVVGEPIGCLLQSPPENEVVLNSLGLMNVSSLPLNSGVYCADIRGNYSELLLCFEEIKKLEKKTCSSGLRHLQNLGDDLQSLVCVSIRNDLICRLPPGDTKVVPCGNVAKVFFDWAIQHGGNPDCAMPAGFFVPHPSPRAHKWSPNQQGDYDARIEELVNTIRARATI